MFSRNSLLFQEEIMKRPVQNIFCITLLILASTGIAGSIPDNSWRQVTFELEQLVNTTPELDSILADLFEMQPDTSYWYGYTVRDFVIFFEDWLFYNPLPVNPALYIEPFDRLANSDGAEMLFNNNEFSSWFIEFLDARGEYLNTASSAECVSMWLADPEIHIDDFVVPEGGFTSFSDYFLRTLKPEARPLDGAGDPSVLVSPADGSAFRILADDIDTSFQVKRDVLNIRQALNNSEYADGFIGGDILNILLWFTDYHHYHAPVSGEIVFIGEYGGSYNYDFRHVDWFRDLARHKRLCYVIDTEAFGNVAMIPVGFWGVGSCINFCSVGDHIEKGQELGHFAYGGSSILLVFEPGAVDFEDWISEEASPVQVRSQIGTAVSQ